MRILVLLLSILFLTQGSALAKEYTKVESYGVVSNGKKDFHQLCVDLKSNFRNDRVFYEYLKDRCFYFETDRYNLQNAIYRFPNNHIPNYNKEYNNLVANYIDVANQKEIANLKEIVTEYCKYNAHLHKKKNSTACSAETLESLF